MERVLVIGGTGAIGSQVAERLAAAGHTVAVYHRGLTGRKLSPGIEHFYGSDQTLPLLTFSRSVVAWSPTVLVHLLAMGQPDARACVDAFGRVVRRCVLISSGDVYAAYGRFVRLESGEPDPSLLSETSPARSILFPYRGKAANQTALEYWYEKLLAEREIMAAEWEWVILRLPKVYGTEINQDLRSVYAFQGHPSWRWTHGYVANVAEAIALAAIHTSAVNRVYNVGERFTPSMGERLSRLPYRDVPVEDEDRFDFAHHLAYDTSRIRQELGFQEPISEEEAMLQVAQNIL